MATARLSAVSNQLEKLTGIVRKNDGRDARSDFEELKEELHNLHTSCDDLISDSNGQTNQSELECAYQVLCEVLAKIGDLLSIINDRTIESSLNEEVASLKKEVGSLRAENGKLREQLEKLQKQMEKLLEDQDKLMVGQLGVKIEGAIISKLIPPEAIKYYHIRSMQSLNEVLSDHDYQVEVFKKNQTSINKMLRDWNDMQIKFNFDPRRLAGMIKTFKERRNPTAHPEFDLQRTRGIVSKSYFGDDKRDLEELITLYEKLGLN